MWLILVVVSVADPVPGSGAFLAPGSGIRVFWIPDIRSRIPDPQPIFFETSGTNLGEESNVTDPRHVDADPDSDYYLLRIRIFV